MYKAYQRTQRDAQEHIADKIIEKIEEPYWNGQRQVSPGFKPV